jgi:hypothetical protein
MKIAFPLSVLLGFGAAYTTTPVLAAPAETTIATLAESQTRGGLPNFAAKLKAGGEVRVAYLGGSITESNGWRVLTTAWLQKAESRRENHRNQRRDSWHWFRFGRFAVGSRCSGTKTRFVIRRVRRQ